MTDAASEPGAVRRRRFGSRGGWLLIVYFTAGGLFLFSGAMAHGANPVHDTAGNIGWILAGLGPLIAYVSYQLLARCAKSNLTRWLLVFLAVGIFLLCWYVGIALLQYALAGQPMLLG